MRKKILVFGNTGFLGSLIVKKLEAQNLEVLKNKWTILNFDAIDSMVKDIKPDYIINAAGITGKPNVDWCEDHLEETYAVNVLGATNIANIAYNNGEIPVIHIGSGCVYDGPKNNEDFTEGYTEKDKPNFFGSTYSRSKIAAEACLKEFPNVLQLRIRIPILGYHHPKNLITKLLNYPAMINKYNSFTVVEDFTAAIINLLSKLDEEILDWESLDEDDENNYGYPLDNYPRVINMTNPGFTNHIKIMSMYKFIVDPTCKIKIMSEDEENELCKRRSNCILDTTLQKKLGIYMPNIEESLERILKNFNTEQYD